MITNPQPLSAVEQVAQQILDARNRKLEATFCNKTSGKAHTWDYRAPWYFCRDCGHRVSKYDLKAATDKLTIELSL
jgi:TPP-dependent indolepyruvate ferredoxin oxidoreductase alpha subunit